jgi:hypothetical protein
MMRITRAATVPSLQGSRVGPGLAVVARHSTMRGGLVSGCAGLFTPGSSWSVRCAAVPCRPGVSAVSRIALMSAALAARRWRAGLGGGPGDEERNVILGAGGAGAASVAVAAINVAVRLLDIAA